MLVAGSTRAFASSSPEVGTFTQVDPLLVEYCQAPWPAVAALATIATARRLEAVGPSVLLS